MNMKNVADMEPKLDGNAEQKRKGFETLDSDHERYAWLEQPRVDQIGQNYVGDARARGGFLTRPQGEER